ncbi:hypothetical protein DNTS_031261 [Danionella cerebrum]|uniref:C2H2-type domain-containing protein n=1 Tax=Danionella cerebrum TaxID=2873325 RepID=A0A553MNH6_9TELE|nr:hypothetical protein DNTS_031261 [Danionella translucida]
MAESVKTFQAHLTAVMDSLLRASVCEITKLFQDTVNDYLVEISLNRKENEALKLRLRLTENKLKNERKYGLCWAAGRRLGSEEGSVRKAALQSTRSLRGLLIVYNMRKEWDTSHHGDLLLRSSRVSFSPSSSPSFLLFCITPSHSRSPLSLALSFSLPPSLSLSPPLSLALSFLSSSLSLSHSREWCQTVSFSPGKQWRAEASDDGAGGARDEGVFRVQWPPGESRGGKEGEEEEENVEEEEEEEEEEEGRMCVIGERKEVVCIKEEVDGCRSDSLRLLQEVLQMNPGESSPHSSNPSHGEVRSSSAPPESSATVWEEQSNLSEEPMSTGDELSGLETALKAEQEREDSESALGNPSQEACTSQNVAFIGLDGLCSSQQGLSSPLQDEGSELPSAPAKNINIIDDINKEDAESGGESSDMLHFCARCGNGFSSSSDLMQHSCEERHFHCSLCTKAFANAWGLKNHECVANSEELHHCELCGKSFTHSRSLERHQLVHTGERPHTCPQCGRSFSRLGNLERHQRIHTGERPYECGACGKRFSRVEYLKRHHQIHIGDLMRNTPQCSQCNQTFSDAEEFKQHQCSYNA